MSALDEALTIQRNPDALYDGPHMKKVIAGLVQLLMVERREHAKELREAIRDSAAHERHGNRSDFGGQDM